MQSSYPTPPTPPTPPTTLAIDLHGLSVKQAKEKVIHTFVDAKRAKAQYMTIVTGIGRHKNVNGTSGVLFHALPKWLKKIPELSAMVQEVKQDQGGYSLVLKWGKSHQEQMSALSREMKELVEKTGSTALLKEQEEKALQGDCDSLALLGSMYVNGIVYDRDIEKGLAFLKKAAEKHHLVKVQLGYIFSSIEFSKHDYNEARKWFLDAAEKSDSDALFELGKMYWLGQGVIRNDQKAFDYLKQAADLGNVSAAHNVAEILFHGVDAIKQDQTLAAHYYLFAATGGMVTSQLMIAKQYFYGRGVKPDDAQAFYWFEQSAQQGNAESAYYVGLCYENGRHVVADRIKAYVWYRKAANLGDPDARFNIAYAQLHGNIFPKNVPEALQQLTHLADEKHANSLYVLGVNLVKSGSDQDVSRGKMYLLNAAELKQAFAKEYLIELLLEGKLTENDEKLLEWMTITAEEVETETLYWCLISLKLKSPAVTWLAKEWFKQVMKRAEGNDTDAQACLAKLYIQGCEVVANDEKNAFQYFERAALKKNRDALTGLGFCYQEGKGTQKNLKQAMICFKEAAILGDKMARTNVIAFLDPADYFTDEGLYWLESAAEDDEVDVQLMLSRLYLSHPDKSYFVSGVYWLYRAALNENQEALNFFRKFDESGSREETHQLLTIAYQNRHHTDEIPEILIWKNRKKFSNSHADIHQALVSVPVAVQTKRENQEESEIKKPANQDHAIQDVSLVQRAQFTSAEESTSGFQGKHYSCIVS